MAKKVIAFDLDGTLAPSKSPVPDRMCALMDRLLEKYEVCVISGGKFEQFNIQLISRLEAAPAELDRLHIMPTCGTRYMKYDMVLKSWEKVYAEDFTPAEKSKISEALDKVAKELGYEEKELYGEVLEDRGSQVSWSVYGQEIVSVLGEEGVHRKEAWDPDNAKKNKMRDAVALLIPEFEVRVGGLTTIDVTKPGIDKAHGMRKLMELLEVGKEDILFIGDRVVEGGNDYPVKEFGIDCIQVPGWETTALVIDALIYAAA